MFKMIFFFRNTPTTNEKTHTFANIGAEQQSPASCSAKVVAPHNDTIVEYIKP